MDTADVETQTFDRFTEKVDVLGIINNIISHSSESAVLEADLEKMTGIKFLLCFYVLHQFLFFQRINIKLDFNKNIFCLVILDKYQEQPHLLDPYLGMKVICNMNIYRNYKLHNIVS